jgi:hypothetical protein
MKIRSQIITVIAGMLSISLSAFAQDTGEMDPEKARKGQTTSTTSVTAA